MSFQGLRHSCHLCLYQDGLALESPCNYYYYNWSYENTYRLMLLEHIS